ncbi:MAG TPA: S1/P1 nuclease [Polyangiaceae bacterium]|nr:S1/P1 nuclease [Polyangiaceae bacterium]
MKRRALALLLLALAWARPGAAWTQAGHMAIAALAYDALPAARRAELALLLRQHPRFQQDFVPHLPPKLSREQEARWIFLWAAAWPDLARGQPEFHRSNWHYLNLPLALQAGTLASCREARAAFPESHRKIQAELARRHPERAAQAAEPGWLTPLGPDEIRPALAWAARTLRDRSLPAGQRALALSWVLHLVGDAHQPLHAVALFDAGRFEFGDRGGNEILVQGQGPLHRFWDALLGDDADAASSYGAVSASVERWRRAPELAALAARARSELDVDSWLDEDCALARSSVYTSPVLAEVQRFQSRRAAASPAPGSQLEEAKPEVALDAGYRQRAALVAERRAVQAGARLGALLGQLQFKSEGLRPRP